MEGEKILISIGYNCTPRIFIKHVYNISKNDGYKTCPFDLCITNYDGLVRCIEEDFANFFTNLQLIYGQNAEGDRSLCGPGFTNITNSYGLVFNHEGSTHSHLFLDGKNDDDYYIRNDFEKFKERYVQRIQNFRNYLKTYNKIDFLYQNYENFNTEYFTKMIEARYGPKDINFIKC